MIKKLTAAAGGQEGAKGAAQMMMRSSWLTEPELEAAYQLIQLSGDSQSSSSSKDGRASDGDLVIMMVAPGDTEAAAVESCGADMTTTKCSAEAIHDQDIASTSSSSSSLLSSSSSSSSSRSAIISTGENLDVWEEMDASCLFMMKRKRKFRSIADLYANTKPKLVKKAAC